MTFYGFSIGQKTPQIVFETSQGKETATYPETIKFYQSLAGKSDVIHIEEKGTTDSGFPLHLITLSSDGNFSYEEAHTSGKTVILIMNGIHPGEADGIEACMMLARDLHLEQSALEEGSNVIIGIIPIYNIGGALNRNRHSRANQNGPLEYGFRGNAQNLDLNRDFVKMDSKNARAFVGIFHDVNPDIFIDTHVSNGADYQYTITHLTTQSDKLGGDLGKYVKKSMIPVLEESMKNKGDEMVPYVNVYGTTPDASGYSQFLDNPRYSVGYTALFNTIGFTVETHMLKPFADRVHATYNFIESVIEVAIKDGKEIKSLRRENFKNQQAGNQTPISWKKDTTQLRQLSFKGYEGETKISKVTGQERLYYNRDKPFTKTIPYFNTFSVDKAVIAPQAYIIPQGWYKIIERLQRNRVKMMRLEKDTTLKVEAYKIETYSTYTTPYEGHYPHYQVNTSHTEQQITFKKGDFVIPVDQPAGRFIIEVLEPEAPDSYFAWNFFDTILQQKEYFSAYAFEDIALQLLNENPRLKARFEKQKNDNADFSNNANAQLDFIYKNSPHYETAHLLYPVFRMP